MSIIILGESLSSRVKKIVYEVDEISTFVGRNMQTVTHNFATDKNDAFKINGNVSFEKACITQSNNTFIELDVVDSKAITLIAVFKPIVFFSEILSNSGNTSATAGVSIGVDNTGALKMWAGNGTVTQNMSLSNKLNLNNWYIAAMTADEAKLNLYNLTTGESKSTSSSGRALNGNKFRVGSPVSGSQNGKNEILLATVIDRVLSKSEIDLVAMQMRNDALLNGIIV